jgi:hypothetical protein
MLLFSIPLLSAPKNDFSLLEIDQRVSDDLEYVDNRQYIQTTPINNGDKCGKGSSDLPRLAPFQHRDGIAAFLPGRTDIGDKQQLYIADHKFVPEIQRSDPTS